MFLDPTASLILVFAAGVFIGLMIQGWRVQEAKAIIRDLDRILCEHERANVYLLAERQKMEEELRLWRQGDGWKVEAE